MSPERQNPDALARARWGAWALTWLSYATYYFGRKGISVSKKSIETELGAPVLVGVDTAYLAAYAVGQSISGFLGDRIGPRLLIGLGMAVSAIACFAFGMSSIGLAFVVAFGVNGLAQSTGWPGTVKAMAEWTPASRRGSVMGWWATCYQVGGIAATGFATWALHRYGWRGAFWLPAIVIAVVGALVLWRLRPGPEGTTTDGGALDLAAAQEARRDAQRALLRQPLIYLYGLSYFFIKLIRYSLLFWLPYYMETVLTYSKERAGWMSTSFEIGGIAGTILLGYVSDRYQRLSRSTWALLSLVGLAASLLLYAQVGASSLVVNFCSMALVGALLFGPDALLSGAAAQDAGGPKAAAIAAGLINAIGSLGAVFQELVTRGLSTRFGWGALFYAFVGFALLSALALVPTYFLSKR